MKSLPVVSGEDVVKALSYSAAVPAGLAAGSPEFLTGPTPSSADVLM